MKVELQSDDKQTARQLWNDLKNGKKDAPERLARVPDKIRDAILSELVKAMDSRETTLNPFD